MNGTRSSRSVVDLLCRRWNGIFIMHLDLICIRHSRGVLSICVPGIFSFKMEVFVIEFSSKLSFNYLPVAVELLNILKCSQLLSQ